MIHESQAGRNRCVCVFYTHNATFHILTPEGAGHLAMRLAVAREKHGRRMRIGATSCFILYKVSLERIYMCLVSSLSCDEVKKRHFICHLGVLKLIFKTLFNY